MNLLKNSQKFELLNQPLFDIKSLLSQTIPTYPDGYLGLKVKNDNQVTCFFNIINNQNLGVGNVAFEAIPEDFVVAQILIEQDTKYSSPS